MGVVLWLILSVLTLHIVSPAIIDNCEKYKTCGECIRDPAICAWCAAGEFNGTRCKTAESLSPSWCPADLQNPRNQINVTDTREFNSNSGQVVQLKPQRYDVKLRPGLSSEFTFSYKAASDYPVDLYFLLDASLTMKSITDKIIKQSEAIYNTMSKLTKDVYIGMGSFIDKNTLPYTVIINSTQTYSFKNRLSLTNDPKLFKNVVENTSFGSNYDEQEGGLDALAQVIACTDIIGWRKESRKFVAFLTDGTYHAAGDGRVASIFQPYDGECYMKDNLYEKELEMDYPSVGIIGAMAARKGITVIFIVREDRRSNYFQLSKAVSEFKCISYEARNNQLQITKLLSDTYNEITRNIKLKVNMKAGQRDNFEINFDPNCLNSEDDSCLVTLGKEKRINGSLKLLKYFGADRSIINIGVEGITENLTLNVEMLKDCSCDSSGIPNSPHCSSAGTLKCGICECDAKRYGDKCACIANSVSRGNDNSTCIAEGDDKLCSGHGSCFCGKCECRKDSPYDGQYCQFNNDNCPRIDGAVCNGHGRCQSEKCYCIDGWTGEACGCPKFDIRCMGDNGKVCNDRGSCPCGKCVCDEPAPWDVRKNQDSVCHPLPCPECIVPQCNYLQPCALCLYSNENSCTSCDYIIAARTEYAISNFNTTWTVCPDISVEVGCSTRYMFKYDDDKYAIKMLVLTGKTCAASYFLYGGITLATLILIGVATIVAWKWLTNMRDRKEYERFMMEHAEDFSQPCQNPTYKSPATTIRNPAFRKPSVDVRN